MRPPKRLYAASRHVAHQQFDTLVLLPVGTIYHGTQRNTMELLQVQQACRESSTLQERCQDGTIQSMDKQHKARTVRLNQQDIEAIATIREH